MTGFHVKPVALFLLLFVNSAVLAVETGSKMVGFVSDSITYGAGTEDRLRFSFPALLQQRIPGLTIRNLGVPGATAALWLKREKELNELAERRPDIVVVMLGTNDSKGGLRKGIEPFIVQYRALVLRLQNFPSRPAVICCSPPSAFENTFNIHPESISDRITPAIKRIADESGAIYINIGAIVRERASFPDGVHPSNAGAKQIADTIEPILKKTLGLSAE